MSRTSFKCVRDTFRSGGYRPGVWVIGQNAPFEYGYRVMETYVGE